MKQLILRPQQIDDSNRAEHAFLTAGDQCFFLCEYTARAGFGHSPANQFILNIKKGVDRRGRPEYRHKADAIALGASAWRNWLTSEAMATITFVPMPPSKVANDPLYDDRMLLLARAVCAGTDGEVRELIVQSQGYPASHIASSGQRRRPEDLAAIYSIKNETPRQIIVILDDMITAGAHFRAASDLLRARWPDRTIAGCFLARRAVPDALAGFESVDADF